MVINVAKDLGIIVGYLYGSFAPEATVTYAEATTMVIRALGYEDEVAKSTESWPTNYTSYAKKLDLYNSIGSFNNNSGAKRGDIANLLWNMLRTGVCTVTGQSTNSGLIYGQGQKMLNKYTNYVYLDGAMITSVTFNDSYSKATVKMADSKDSLSVSLTASEVLEYYAKKLDVLYNKSSKSIFSIDSEKEYKEVKGSITKIKSSKIYFDDDYYTLPSDSNILLYKVDKLSEAIDATLYMSGSTVKYVLATGAKEVKLALVTDNDLTIDTSKDGIKIKDVGSSKKTSYMLINKSDMPEEGSIVLYYLNSDDELGIVKEIKLDDASAISSLTSTKIKVGSKTYTYDSETFEIVSATSSAVSTLKFSKIVKAEDMVYVYDYAGTTYLVVFDNAVESETTVATAKKELQNYVTSVDGKYAEANYSQATWYNYNEALTSAKTLLNSSSPKASKLSTALTNLKTAVSELKSVSKYTTEGRIAQYRANIRSLVNGKATTIVSEKSKYTTTSYEAFSDALSTAKKLLARTDTTETETKTAYDNLNNAINSGMKLVKDTDEHKDAVSLLNQAIEDANSKVGSNTSDDYVESTWTAYQNALNKAETISKSSANYSVKDVKDATKALKDAAGKLELAAESLRDELNALIVSCLDKQEEYYMPKTFETFSGELMNAKSVSNNPVATAGQLKTALDKLETANDNLVTREKALENAMETVESIRYNPDIDNACKAQDELLGDKLIKINNIEKVTKQALSDIISTAKTQDLSGDVDIKLGEAKIVRDNKDATLEEVVEAYKNLYEALHPQTTEK